MKPPIIKSSFRGDHLSPVPPIYCIGVEGERGSDKAQEGGCGGDFSF